MVLTLSVYGLLAFAWCRRSTSLPERTLVVLLTAAWCGAAGFARVRLGSHWPSDVIAGAMLGTAWLIVLILALRQAEREALPAVQ
jgi:undecaprenyl-diphosphatase